MCVSVCVCVSGFMLGCVRERVRRYTSRWIRGWVVDGYFDASGCGYA